MDNQNFLIFYGIDPKKIAENFKNGKYNRPIQKKIPIKIENNTKLLNDESSKNINDSIFTYGSKNIDINIVIATTDCKRFETYTSSGGKIENGGICDYCESTFTCKPTFIPIKYKNYEIYVNDNGKTVSNTVHVFWGIYKFCCFECALAKIIAYNKGDYTERFYVMQDSTRLLKLMFSIIHGCTKILIPKNEKRLHEKFGGSLNDEKWNDQTHQYIYNSSVLIFPVKLQYIKQFYPGNMVNRITDFSLSTT